MSKEETMTPYERLMAAFERRQPDRVPVTPFVREWCLRQCGFKFSEAILEGMKGVEKYVYSQIYCIRKFGYDMVLDLLAIHAESEAMGSKLHIPEDAPPSVAEPAVKDYQTDLPKLRIPNPYKDGRLPYILEIVRRMKDIFEGYIPVMGYTQAPSRHVCMLRGTEAVMRDYRRNPGWLHELFEIATDSLIVWGCALIEAGADIIWVSDPTSSGDMISRKTFEEFCYPYLKRLVKALKTKKVKVFLHICGDVNDRLDLMADTGVDAISVDEKVDLKRAKELIGDKVCLMGNVSPGVTLLSGTPQQVEEESKAAIEAAAAGGGFVLASGCLVPGGVPAENIAAMVSAAKKYGFY